MDSITLADYIYPAIQKQYVALLTHEADLLSDGDIEAVHQMRVSLRRLRSVIQAFVPILDTPKIMGEKQIAKIAKILGKVRDLDVLHDTCKKYQSDLPASEQVYLDEIGAAIGKRRRKALFKVQSMFEAQEYQQLKLSINNWLNHAQYQSIVRLPIADILPDIILPIVSRLFLNSGWWLELDLSSAEHAQLALRDFITANGQGLHDLRKQVKTARYLMELFPDRYHPDYHYYLKDFKHIHQLLGDIQDTIIFDNFAQKVVGRRASDKLPTVYARIVEHNYLTWQSWEQIKQRYQKSQTKQALHLLLIQGMVGELVVSC